VCIHTLPHDLQLRTLPPYRGGLQRYHVPYGSRPHLPVEVGSGAAMCHMAPDPTSLPRWASMLPRVQWHRTSPPGRGGLRHCCMSYGS
jgi:hypothetical protein